MRKYIKVITHSKTRTYVDKRSEGGEYSNCKGE